MATATQALVASAVLFFAYHWFRFHSVRSKIDHVPTVGSDNFLLSFVDVCKAMLFAGDKAVKEGYRKYRGSAFKIRTPYTSTGWYVVVSGEQMIEELRTVSSDVLSFLEGVAESLQTEYTSGPQSRTSHAQVPVIRGPLTRSLMTHFSDLKDELVNACDTFLPDSSDWEVLPSVHETNVHIVCRTSNRIFVGLPLCRDPEFLKLQEGWTISVVLGSFALLWTPDFLKPVVGPLVSRVKSTTRKVEAFLRETILERTRIGAKNGAEWERNQEDLISWMIDAASPESRDVETITSRVMLVNFAAIHTISLVLTSVMLELAARREYHEALREEIEEMISTYGWSKESTSRMLKLDSFLKESIRVSGMANFGSPRKAMKDFTFSNGITIPAGYTVTIAASGIHADPEIYEDPMDFKGFRFYDMNQKDAANQEEGPDMEGTRNQSTSLDPTWWAFGHGRHACPGRSFALTEVKAILCHLLLNYDLKLPNDATEPPPGFWFAGQRAPQPGAKILFRKRMTA
ncbi:cytochrome P450 [Ephemerocybe angulata]|uniref:Cytochrome P450 n=1 Tax=Ephemerocybe angulata TaxID=980116 RepID=A0A8H6HL72_9AGAR|nr:cytochrome P450 [Tulosesus angulatus]